MFVIPVLFFASISHGLDDGFHFIWAKRIVRCWSANPLSEPNAFAQRTPGPGMLVAPFYAALSSSVDTNLGVLASAAAFLIGVFWLTFYSGLREIWSHRTACLGVLVAATCTPIGWYSRWLTTETFSLFPCGFLLLETCRLLNGKSVNWWTVGAATALLLIIRPYLGAFAWPVLLPGLYVELRNQRVAPFVISILLIGLGLLIVGLTQWAMTGSPLKSTYDFGDEHFQSIDLTNWRYQWHVIFDVYHGALPYAPAMGIGICGICGMLWDAIRRKRHITASVYGLTLIAIAINIWFLGGFYYFTMSAASWGSRGLVTPAIRLSLAFLRPLRH